MSGVKCTDKTTEADRLSKPDGYTAREWARIQTQEAAEKKKQLHLLFVTVFLVALAALMVFLVYYFVIRSHDYTLFYPYENGDPVFSSGSSLPYGDAASAFAENLCVTSGETNITAV